MEETKKSYNPLRLFCQNCGAPAGFDIIRQTYSCPNCGQVSGIEEVNQDVMEWKKLQKKNIKARTEGQNLEEHSCPTCSAQVIFKGGEASRTCDFCGSQLIRQEFIKPEQMPELIIPFFLTPEEAKERMLKWAQENAKTPEGKAILSSMNELRGYYLPYQLVRGPVSAIVTRDGNKRQYYCDGYLDGTAINTSKQLDNLTLNAMEPFDWTEARPFEYGYIAGQNVKLSDISGAQTEKRVLQEVEEDFLPTVEKIMQTSGVGLRMKSGNLLTVPALLPVYFIKTKNLTAALNGQTGRIAASTGREKNSLPWVVEPTVYTLIAVALLGYFSGSLELAGMGGLVLGIIFFTVFEQGRTGLSRRIVLQSDVSKAERRDGKLSVEEGINVLKNPYDNTPVFREDNGTGQLVPVRLRFYPPGRWISVAFNLFITIFLPAIIAAFFRWVNMEPGEKFTDGFAPEYGAAWYVLAAFIAILYWTKGVRKDAYDHPYIYEILENGKQKLIGSSDSRKLSVFSMFGIGELDASGKRIGIFKLLRMMGSAGLFLGGTILFILIGSVAAILD